jgi:hypothetical protein
VMHEFVVRFVHRASKLSRDASWRANF